MAAVCEISPVLQKRLLQGKEVNHETPFKVYFRNGLSLKFNSR
jgi:hypothetical protein